MSEIDLALALDRLVPNAQYHRFDTYANLAADWFDVRPIPTEIELQAAWDAILVERAVEETNATSDNDKIMAAKVTARNIPNWATWDEATALAWFDARLSGINIDALTSLADAKITLKDMATVNRALIRMVLALRDHTWPGLIEDNHHT